MSELQKGETSELLKQHPTAMGGQTGVHSFLPLLVKATFDDVLEWLDDHGYPDIETAAEVLDPYMVHPLDVMEATKATVDAALGITEDTQ